VEVRDITPPTAVAGADIGLDQHQVARFDGRGSSDNVDVAAWTWEIDSGSNVLLYGSSPTQLFDVAGTYKVTLTVRDPSGNTATDTLTVVVRDITPPVADAGPGSVINQGQTATFTGERCADNVGVVSWEWTFEYGSTPVSLSGPNESYTFGAPGVYLITLKATDAAGNSASATTHLKVTDIVPPSATLHMVLDAKKGVPVTLDGSGSTDNVGIVNWTWRIRLEGESAWREVYGETPRFTFQKPGDHSVQLVVTDADGNTATSERVTVHVPNTMLWIFIIVIVATAVLLLVAAAARRRRRD
jgi:PKD repeat protein